MFKILMVLLVACFMLTGCVECTECTECAAKKEEEAATTFIEKNYYEVSEINEGMVTLGQTNFGYQGDMEIYLSAKESKLVTDLAGKKTTIISSPSLKAVTLGRTPKPGSFLKMSASRASTWMPK